MLTVFCFMRQVNRIEYKMYVRIRISIALIYYLLMRVYSKGHLAYYVFSGGMVHLQYEIHTGKSQLTVLYYSFNENYIRSKFSFVITGCIFSTKSQLLVILPQVHTLSTRCWWRGTCNCGIAIRSHDSLFVVRTCDTISTVHYSPRRHHPYISYTACDDEHMTIQQLNGGYKVCVHLLKSRRKKTYNQIALYCLCKIITVSC